MHIIEFNIGSTNDIQNRICTPVEWGYDFVGFKKRFFDNFSVALMNKIWSYNLKRYVDTTCTVTYLEICVFHYRIRSTEPDNKILWAQINRRILIFLICEVIKSLPIRHCERTVNLYFSIWGYVTTVEVHYIQHCAILPSYWCKTS